MTTSLAVMRPAAVQEVQEAVLATPRLHVVGGHSKPAISTPADPSVAALEMTGLSGILEYDPGEYTFTALAGTSLATVEAALAEHGQYMPFDPPLAEAGATLGGTVAAGLSGSGRQRYGGVRDFLIGVRLVDGQGRLVRGGGKVVKNAAGFDLPKLMVGSLGQLGVLVEASFKVFPQPPAYATLCVEQPSLDAALEGLAKLANAPFDIDALDVAVTGNHVVMWVRLGGLERTLPPRLDGLAALLGDGTRTTGEAEHQIWRAVNRFDWATDGAGLVKVPLSPATLLSFDNALQGRDISRRYCVGGNVAWLAWDDSMEALDALLSTNGLAGLALTGSTGKPLLGSWPGVAFYRRIKETLDPAQRLPDFFA